MSARSRLHRAMDDRWLESHVVSEDHVMWDDIAALLSEKDDWANSRGLAAPDGGPSSTYFDRLREKSVSP